MSLIIVASKNPVKIEAARRGFERAFPQRTFTVEGVTVDSGVSDQPRTDNETRLGALNRSGAARAVYPEGDFFVGMEGGVERVKGEWEAFAWMVIMDKAGKIGRGRTGVFVLPAAIGKLLDTGMELGEADDQVFDLSNSKQNTGAVGILTKGMINRTAYYEPAILFALIPWLMPGYYPTA
ncbi:MAG: inosine/xanthosine triphosphatase [Candidatus Marinimicrobia bacterium]|nr:inosine/xanthosine triphosphatase [Candidatus Neomarinimicrobiota bacterium]MCF7840129.1 inosine/xanthosine triphosphatase [Candidatus Neomarinimicrobiota bacterium]